MKHCCKNVVILMPEPVAEPALNGLRLNLRIVSIVMFNFASYLTIGLPLAVLPGYVHDVMGFSAFWAGLVISLQYFATLLSRPHAGRYADLLGPKKIVVFGLCGCFLSGLGYLTAGLTASLPVISLLSGNYKVGNTFNLVFQFEYSFTKEKLRNQNQWKDSHCRFYIRNQ